MRKITTFPTARPLPLMGTMCKHFAHKITVEQDETRAVLRFPWGVVEVEAHPTGLALAIDAADAEGFEHTRDVLIDHMLRFAHREAPEAPVWQDA